jgi:hypothetical protein
MVWKLTLKENTYPSRRIAFVMSSTFFLVSTKIIILFPLSTPISRSSFDNLCTKHKTYYLRVSSYKNQVWLAVNIYGGKRGLQALKLSVKAKPTCLPPANRTRGIIKEQ